MATNNAKIIKLLKRLPEVKLGLIDMLWNVVDENGQLVPDKVLLYQKELSECVQEAEEYIIATRKAVSCLLELVRNQSVSDEDQD